MRAHTTRGSTLRNAWIVVLASTPLALLGCGEGLAGDQGDGGGGDDSSASFDGPSSMSEGGSGQGMDAGGGTDATQGHDTGGEPMDGSGGPEVGGGEAGEGPDGSTCGTCPSGSVCCEPPLGCGGMCVADCRLGGTCPQNLTCDQTTGVCSPGSDGGTMPPPDGGMMPPPDGGMMPPPDGGMMPPPDGGMTPPPDGGMTPPPDGGSSSCGTCPTGDVCCAAPLGCAGMCVPDCRQGGTCPPNLTCNQSTGVCSPSVDGGMMPPPDGGMMPPPDGGMMPPPDGGMKPPPDGGMKPPPDGGTMPPPDGGTGVPDGGGGGSDAGDGSGAAPPGIGTLGGGGGVKPPYSGNNVSIDDSTIVLGDSGAACYNGTADVYVWDGVSSWQVQQQLTDPDAAAMGGGYNFNCFGGATAVKGDVAFVSSPSWGNFEGEVYEYTRSGTSWTLASSIVDSTFNGSTAYFGYALAYDGTRLVAGAPALKANNGGTYAGRVDVLTKGNVNWNLQKAIYAPVVTAGTSFGTSVALNGSRLAVGADGGVNKLYSVTGAAYTYTVSGSTWTYESGAVGTDTQAADGFGESVALAAAGTFPALLVVGAPGASPLGAQSGAAYVFYLDGSSSQWVQSTKLVPSDGAAGDTFGYAVGAISSTEVIVGAAGASKAYLFTNTGASWSQTTIYQSCPVTIGWSMATWGTLAVTAKGSAVVLDTSLANPGCGGN